jgi:hypothetical protein
VALLIAVVALLRLRPDQVPGHAYAIPSAHDRSLVEVLNGSGLAGGARLGTRQLRGRGFDVVYLGNAAANVDSTQVIARRGETGPAEEVRASLGFGVVRNEPDTLRRVDVTVILGPDYHPEEGGRP